MITPSLSVASDATIVIHHFTPHAAVESDVIVLCHPTGLCALTYASMVAHMRGYDIWGIDIRCHGASERGDVTNWQGFQRDVDAAFDEISRVTGHEKFWGVGISSGSSAHILNAALHPELYRGLYLCEPILVTPDTDIAGRTQLIESAQKRRDTFSSRDEVYERFHTRGPLSHLSDSALALYATYGFTDIKDGVTLSCHREDEANIYRSGAVNGVFDALSKVQTPSRIVYGETSTTVTQKFATMIAEHMGNADIAQMDGVGHFTLLENPYAGARDVLAWIESFHEDGA